MSTKPTTKVPWKWRVRWFIRGMSSLLRPISTEEFLKEVDRCVDEQMKEWVKENPPPCARQFRRLEMGEIVRATDEIYDDHKREWVAPKGSVGKPAPDPSYTSHRQFRREIQSDTP